MHCSMAKKRTKCHSIRAQVFCVLRSINNASSKRIGWMPLKIDSRSVHAANVANTDSHTDIRRMFAMPQPSSEKIWFSCDWRRTNNKKTGTWRLLWQRTQPLNAFICLQIIFASQHISPVNFEFNWIWKKGNVECDWNSAYDSFEVKPCDRTSEKN